MRATPHSMVCCQDTILRHYDDILPDLSYYTMHHAYHNATPTTYETISNISRTDVPQALLNDM